MTFSGKSADRMELRNHFLFKRLSAGTWPCREWATFVSCFFFSTLAHTSLLMSGGAIPSSRYCSSTCVWPQTSGNRSTCVVQFRIQFGSMWRSGPNWACVFSCGVRQRQAVILMVLALQPQLEYFFRRLFRVTTFIFVLCMCCL